MCGSGVVLFLNEFHHIKIKWGLGDGTKNYDEFMTLLMHTTVENRCRSLQIFGDSMKIINWENIIQRCHILRLFPILEEVLIIKQHFDYLIITHVYNECNRLDDFLSKEDL